ncbi:glycosyltransferase [Flavobacterium sp. CYK-55]|uniref:glycosyltransferase n=1 Tax=Flavobacterium sp. CYK-55 TaxID=2835529 RepID=UPI001BCB8559|nr:glycosyltransferase [Flavobacterium sp. CYK-55]MBS7786437.1 glycosyltransferase [Flavobacterium sp. CYK-55]
MSAQKILIVTNGFYPEISPRSFRATELAKELVRQGHQVTVLTHPREDVSEFCAKHGIEYKNMGAITWKPFTIKGSGLVRLFWRLVTRFSSLLFEYPNIQIISLLKKTLCQFSGYDLMISVAVPYPIHWGVAAVRTSKKPIAKKWIADCGDPYMGQENDTFKPPFYFGWLEKRFCRKADYITVPTSASINGYYPEFRSKIRVIPQGFKFEDVQRSNEPLNQEKIIFGYGGMFIPGRRDPSEFLNYLNSLDQSIKFEFHVYTTTPHMVEPFIENSKGRIILKPIVKRDALLFEMSKMHFVVNFENVGSTQTPSKLIDFAIIEKPILSIKFGGLKTEVVDQFLNQDYQNAFKIEQADQYRIERVAQQFLNIE